MFPNNVYQRTTRKVRLLSIVGLVVVLQACGNVATRDLREFVETAYQDKKPEIEPLPVIEPY